MERLVKKYEQWYRRALDQHNKWQIHQSELLKQFANATAIIERLPVLLNSKNYGVLEKLPMIQKTLQASQIFDLERIRRLMQSTLVEMEKIAKSFEKLERDGAGLLVTEKFTKEQFEERVGSRPSLNICTGGLHNLYIMHRDELKLKVGIISSLHYESRSEDLRDFERVLRDQPNLPPDEVEQIFERVLGDEWCQ